jgi:TAG lipase/steryl ester hydrolase/phospholipase A2/LPA acyltransferase
MQMWADNYDWERNFDLTFFSKADFGRFIKNGGSGLYSVEFLKECMKRNVGELTFMEAYDRTGRICNISVSGHSGSTKFPMLCNYFTTPNVLIYSAIVASCSLPGVFEPLSLLAKGRPGPDGKREIVPYIRAGLKWLDGSMQSDLPMARLGELFNVNFFIVSQVNPQARLFTGQGVGSPTGPIFSIAQFLRRQLKQSLLSFSSLLLGTSGRVSPWLRPVGFTPVGLIVQEYEGDVTIFNGGGMTEAFNLLNNGSNKILRTFTKASEWETWWYMTLIQNACAIEVAMNEIIEDLQAQLSGITQISVSEPVSPTMSATMSRRPSILHSRSFVLPDHTESESREGTKDTLKVPDTKTEPLRRYVPNAAALKAHSSQDFLKQGLFSTRMNAVTSCASLVDATFGSCEDAGRNWSRDSSKNAARTTSM